MSELMAKVLRDKELLKFRSYEDYLESLITARDLYHFRSKSVSRRIIELGYHIEGTLNRDTFYDRVESVKRYIYLLENPYSLCSKLINPKDALLQELAIREKANRIGELCTIIFMRYVTSQSQISGYIDYCYRLKSEDWLPYFTMTNEIKLRKNDLSYYDWKYQKLILNESPNFKPIVDGKNGFGFQNNFDLKFITVGSSLTSDSDPARLSFYSEIYGHVVLYDHNIQI